MDTRAAVSQVLESVGGKFFFASNSRAYFVGYRRELRVNTHPPLAPTPTPRDSFYSVGRTIMHCMHCEKRTQQATVDFEAQDEAVLAKILVPAGTPDVAVGTPMMVLIESEDDVPAFKDFSAVAAPETAAAPAAVEAEAAPTSSEPAPAAAAAAAAPPAAPGGRVAASPLAKLVSDCC